MSTVKKPGSSSRGRGGKFKKFTRGGGKHFSKNLQPLDADGNEVGGLWGENKGQEAESSEEEEEESSSEEEKPEMTREERRQAAKAKKLAAIAKKNAPARPGELPPTTDSEEESDDDMPGNPNLSTASRAQASAAPQRAEDDASQATAGIGRLAVSKKTGDLSRREREVIAAQEAKERYMKLHLAGQTDEAKADMARLKLIREKRDAEAARKKAEQEEKEAQVKANRAEIDAKEQKKRAAAMGTGVEKKKGKK